MSDPSMSSARVALVASRRGEHSAALAVGRLTGLLRHGWDAHLVFDGPDASAVPWSPELRDSARDGRVHLSPRCRPRGVSRASVPIAVGRALLRRPRASAQYLRAGGRPGPRLLLGHDAEALLIALRPDVVHFDSLPSAAARPGLRALIGCRSVATLAHEDLRPNDREMLQRYRTVCDQVDVLDVAEDADWRRLLSLGCPPRTARVRFPATAPDPGPLEDHTPASGVENAEDEGSRGVVRILSVGPLSWAAGYEWALQAIASMRDSGIAVEYRIVGRGEHRDAVSFASHQLGLHRVMELVDGHLHGSDPGEHLRWADIYLDCSVAQGATGALEAALARGLPAVVTERSLPEPADPQTVLVVPRRDPRSTADSLAQLAKHVALARDFVRAGYAPDGRQRENTRPASGTYVIPPEHVAELDRFYRTLLGSGGLSRR